MEWLMLQGDLAGECFHLQPVRFVVNDRGLFTAGWFGMRENTVPAYNPRSYTSKRTGKATALSENISSSDSEATVFLFN